jgi:hypothetical protein
MSISRRNLYILLSLGLVLGYLWLLYSLKNNPEASDEHSGVCLFRYVTGIPCPSCGSTRSVISLLHGQFIQALLINPLGILVALIMFAIPFWLFFDLVTGKETLYKMYAFSEDLLKKPGVAAPLIALVLINWIWNILKGL